MRIFAYAIQMTLVFIFISIVSFSQNIDSMMNVYADLSAPERIHIHFDKNIYNKGETVWYKIYVLQGSNLIGTSKNIYLEWYGADGKPICQTVAPLVLSASSGSFDIPIDYKGEVLEVRAFTRWMLNDDSAFIYHRNLLINNEHKFKLPASQFSKTNVTIFPEGGFLIKDLRSRIAFKATNAYGDPVFITGVLVDNENNNIDSIHVLHDGMGSFFLTPSNNHDYYLNWTDEFGVTGKTSLPVIKTEGAQLTVIPKKEKTLFQIECSKNISANFRKMNLVIHMNRVALYHVTINTAEKKSINAEIPIKDLPTGLLQFTLFTSDWIPVAERVLFINNGTHEFFVRLTEPVISFESKAKNSFEIFVPDTLFTNMSLSVSDADLSIADHHTIFSDLFLNGEIKGKVYNPGYYLSANTDEIAEHMDLVMLTNGWRRFDWDKIKAQIGPKMEYPVENEYMKLIGKVLGLKAGRNYDLNMIIVNKDSARQFVSVPLQKDGSFEYPIILFDTASIFYSINNDQKLTEKVKLEIQNGLFYPSPKNITPLNRELPVSNESGVKQKLDQLLIQQDLNRKRLAETTLKEVTVTAKIKTKEEKLDEKYSSGFFKESPAKKAYLFDLTDPRLLTSAQTVMEYLMNRVPGLIVNGNSMQWRGNSPIVYLNEMRSDIATIGDIPLQHIAMIKAFPPLFMFATGSGAGGAIAVYTKMGADDTILDQPGLKSVNLSGYTKFKEFYNPDYEEHDNFPEKQDNRITLYWNPNLITNKFQQSVKVDFFNNDFTKSFKIVLEGINSAGKMMRVIKVLNKAGLDNGQSSSTFGRKTGTRVKGTIE